jgi:hypothetical protein
MDESTAPFGKNEKRQSANEKIFELTTASSAYFFIHILPLLILSKVGCVRWGGDNGNGGTLYSSISLSMSLFLSRSPHLG